jgi:hypothetical protein
MTDDRRRTTETFDGLQSKSGRWKRRIARITRITRIGTRKAMLIQLLGLTCGVNGGFRGTFDESA